MNLPELQTSSYQFLCNFISEQAGVELGPDRQYLVESRLLPVLEDAHCKSLADLCRALLRESQSYPPVPILKHKIIHALTTHETSFFRDPDLFRSLRNSILPELTASNSNGRLRLLSAAASSGQEAYSLAILAAEMSIRPLPLFIATDISSIVLGIAAEGYYSDYELLRGMQDPALREKYFSPRKGGAQVVTQIRQCIEYHCCDLRDSNLNFAPLDLILCRNVLIYFDEPTRNRVLEHLLKQLRPGGILILGSAEAIFNNMPGISRIASDSFTYYRKTF